MQIAVGSLLRGAQEAEGTAIIIDVFRAFTTAAVAFSRGAERIVLVAEVADALRLRDQGHGDLCMGEVSGMRPEGFDFGNSPYELSRADVDGRRLIQSTRAGTVGVAAATRAERIYAGSLVTAEATAKAVLRDSPEIVSIVAMGAEGRSRADEDEQCALYLRNLFWDSGPTGARCEAWSSPAPKRRSTATPPSLTSTPATEKWQSRSTLSLSP